MKKEDYVESPLTKGSRGGVGTLEMARLDIDIELVSTRCGIATPNGEVCAITFGSRRLVEYAYQLENVCQLRIRFIPTPSEFLGALVSPLSQVPTRCLPNLHPSVASSKELFP